MPRNFSVSLPNCRHCGRFWRPPHGVMATQEYCSRCSKERRKITSEIFEARVLTGNDLVGGYLMPRKLRVV